MIETGSGGPRPHTTIGGIVAIRTGGLVAPYPARLRHMTTDDRPEPARAGR